MSEVPSEGRARADSAEVAFRYVYFRSYNFNIDPIILSISPILHFSVKYSLVD